MNGNETEKTRKGRVTVGKAIAFILIALVAYCCIFSLFVKAFRGDSLPMPLGFGAGVVLTGSMEPTYKVNDLIIAVKAKDYKVGDIVVYQTGGTPVVHRVIEMDKDSGVFVAKGDANNAPDDPVTVSRIKGRVLFAIPFAGAAMRFIKTVPGMIMILVVIFVLLTLSLRAREQDKQEEDKVEKMQREIIELRRQFEAAAKEEKAEENAPSEEKKEE
ncbi:MAG: signal peptidase I [Clostridiales bacterium]|nr:signal peptidase I [Clostridiales bacterium]